MGHSSLSKQFLLTAQSANALKLHSQAYYRESGDRLDARRPCRWHRYNEPARSGEVLSCDLVVIAIGATANVKFLRGSGIRLDDGVLVNEQLETSMPGIFGAGDVANFLDPVFKQCRRIEHWDNAVKQGRLVAKNMLGRRQPYEEVPYLNAPTCEQ